MIEFQATNPIRDLEDSLAPRRAAEARHHKGPTAHGHTNLLLRANRVLGPLLKLALRGTGIYGRGLRNALQLRVRHLRFVFPNLPPWLHGFRILHLSDLHIDGVRGLTKALCDCVREIPVDLCVLTGDYRFEAHGPCHAVYPHIERLLHAVRSRRGVLGILGNHDEADMAIAFEQLGVRMLINESTEVEPGLWVIGVDDAHYYGCDDLSRSLGPVTTGGVQTAARAHPGAVCGSRSGRYRSLPLRPYACRPDLSPALGCADCECMLPADLCSGKVAAWQDSGIHNCGRGLLPAAGPV